MAINLTRVLCGRALMQSLRCPVVPARCVTLKVIQAEQPKVQSFDEKNMALGRAMSPHLTIYKPQLTSMLSISHRFTGMALTGYAAALGVGALVLPNDFAYWVTAIEGLHLGATSLALIKFSLAFPATYHTINGVRHLFWDNGFFLSLKDVYTTGWLMLALSVVTAAGLAAI